MYKYETWFGNTFRRLHKWWSNYRPQTSFAKVMFLHLSVSHSVHSREGLHPGGATSGRVGQTPPRPQLDTAGYGQRAGDTHPTGMHSCYNIITTCRLHRCETGPCILRNFERVHINWCQFDIFEIKSAPEAALLAKNDTILQRALCSKT